jgi:hypothetical protein
MSRIDLRVLALADSKLLPPEVQKPFDSFRILRARDAVARLVRKRMGDIQILNILVERLEAAEDEDIILGNLTALMNAVDVFRTQTGLHKDYCVVIMSQHLNPWGVVDFQRDFEAPMPYALEAAERLWNLCRAHLVDVPALLQKVREPLLDTLDFYYEMRPPDDIPENPDHRRV